VDPEKIETKLTPFGRLIELVETLRGENGCPWDKKQTARSMAVKMLEETYELVDAVSNGQPGDVGEELGDVLFHIFFIARLFQEEGVFGIKDVADGIIRKMIRRHPHVFDNVSLSSAEEVKQQWHTIKRKEKAGVSSVSILDSIPRMLPALMRAYRISERAAREGFDWSNLSGVMEKVMEEWRELKDAIACGLESSESRQAVQLEFGDLLFTLVNVARFLGINPEAALTESTEKFEGRFRYMEQVIKESRREMTRVSQKEKDDIWESAKAARVA
jgi:tetrapyrrole methylase family protein / MazG family protein